MWCRSRQFDIPTRVSKLLNDDNDVDDDVEDDVEDDVQVQVQVQVQEGSVVWIKAI